jgi:glycosyltransferase involved in cell wall biosynthesis
MCERSNLSQPAHDHQPYFAYLGRIIEPKGVHLAIAAVRAYNQTAEQPLKLRIAGKHYGSSEKKSYWDARIQPELDETIAYAGFIDSPDAKRDFLCGAAALIVPSVFDEPFGMVAIEAMACGTPVIALNSGALPEIIEQGKTGFVAEKVYTTNIPSTASVTPAKTLTPKKIILNETKTIANLQIALQKWPEINRQTCRTTYESHFTAETMCQQYAIIYNHLLRNTK